MCCRASDAHHSILDTHSLLIAVHRLQSLLLYVDGMDFASKQYGAAHSAGLSALLMSARHQQQLLTRQQQNFAGPACVFGGPAMLLLKVLRGQAHQPGAHQALTETAMR